LSKEYTNCKNQPPAAIHLWISCLYVLVLLWADLATARQHSIFIFFKGSPQGYFSYPDAIEYTGAFH